MSMTKYGVVLDDENVKVASSEGRPCPSCGSKRVNYAGLTPHCPNCGVEPWSKKRNDGEIRKDHQR